MSQLLFVGDVSYDVVFPVPRLPEPDEKLVVDVSVASAGGVVANAAVAAALAGPTRPLLALRHGTDPLADTVLGELSTRGVEVCAETAPGATCRVVVLLEPHGEKRLVLQPGVSMYPGVAHVDGVDLTDGVWAHTAVYDREAAGRLVGRCRDAGVPWSLDLEPATFPDGIDALAPHLRGAAVVFCNDRAAAALGPAGIRRLFELGVDSVVRTHGPRGASWTDGHQRMDVPAPPPVALGAPVRDSTGAGDCLAGSFVARRAAGDPVRAALDYAVTAASLACTAYGAQPSYPTPERVRAVLAHVR